MAAPRSTSDISGPLACRLAELLLAPAGQDSADELVRDNDRKDQDSLQDDQDLDRELGQDRESVLASKQHAASGIPPGWFRPRNATAIPVNPSPVS